MVRPSSYCRVWFFFFFNTFIYLFIFLIQIIFSQTRWEWLWLHLWIHILAMTSHTGWRKLNLATVRIKWMMLRYHLISSLPRLSLSLSLSLFQLNSITLFITSPPSTHTDLSHFLLYFLSAIHPLTLPLPHSLPPSLPPSRQSLLIQPTRRPLCLSCLTYSIKYGLITSKPC